MYFTMLLMPLVGFPGGASGKEPAFQCRRHRRLRFDPWVRKIPWRGNGNPLQYSCLENPRDGGAWWAAVYGVPQSRTQLKRLSSSSSSSSSSNTVDQQIWKTEQWPQDWKRSVFIPIPKRQCQRMLKLPHNCTHDSDLES